MDLRDCVILLVDDDELVTEILADMFQNDGLNNVFTAQNGSEALDILEREKDINLILSDYQMPGMTGLELLEKIRKDENRVLFILTTDWPGEEIKQKAIKAGADVFLRKPLSLIKVRGVIKNFQTRRR